MDQAQPSWACATSALQGMDQATLVFQYLSQLPSEAMKLVCNSDSCSGHFCCWSLLMVSSSRSITNFPFMDTHSYVPKEISAISSRQVMFLYVSSGRMLLLLLERNPFNTQSMTADLFAILKKQYIKCKQDSSRKPVIS